MNEVEQTIAFLHHVDMLAGVPEPLLAQLAERSERREVAAGAYLFKEGDEGSYFFIVESGELEVRKAGEGGGEALLRVMGPREVGGLTSMLVSKRRSASLRALGPVSVWTVARPVFEGLLSEPDFVRSAMAFLSAKVRGKSHRLASLLEDGPPDHRRRVAVFDSKPYDRASLQAAAGDDLHLTFFEARLQSATARLAAGFNAVCAFVNDELNADVIEQLAAGGVRHVALRCAGYNNVDLEAAARHQVAITRVPAYSPHAVAEHAVALILTLNRHTHHAYNRVRDGNFSLRGLVGFDLHGRTAGIIGLGKIGQCLGQILKGFGMQVLAYDAYPDETVAKELGVSLVSLEALVRQSDIISLHAPLTPNTYHMIDAGRIAAMKPGALLINTSRGGLLDAAALVEGLKNGHIGAAGLDVYEEESEYFFEDRSGEVIDDDLLARLMTFPNVLITSHQAFLTREALGNIADTTLANIREHLRGKRGAELSNTVLASSR